MRLIDLSLQNIGPFDDAKLDFLTSEEGEVPVAIITGENGAGKSIILDAIRGLFGGAYTPLERSIVRPNETYELWMTLALEGQRHVIPARAPLELDDGRFMFDQTNVLGRLPLDVQTGALDCPNWVVDFWRSTRPNDSYKINHFGRYDPRQFLMGSLQGIQRNAAVTELICHFDYLRSSNEPKEKVDGDLLYETVRDIFRVSLLDGELSHVRRMDFTPMVRQSGQLVPLANLSSGNAYLVQHLISLLGKMYAVHVLRETPPEDLCKTPGLLLIDEAENHLHPRWQKRFLRDVLRIFPNLQIIATTHSPFIVASVPGAKVFVCRYDRDRKTCVVEDESRHYENKPIEEILLSAAFEETQPFGPDMTDLIEARKQAVERGDEERRRKIEAELKRRNPDYFSYLDIDERLAALREKAS
ncbi:AAA family ATPase [Polyangium mundeleinium]|uniref:AAA family ATPase n=1 Tax=Polyangium mundeleinium TaxID=2995306 RepID=A0ABT5EVH1_9BACT|nr:AAA family ATPase [Polyangium mundeleinium]MDC0745188.1 AAA family ATPase [Polyangium mundeleinium]